MAFFERKIKFICFAIYGIVMNAVSIGSISLMIKEFFSYNTVRNFHKKTIWLAIIILTTLPVIIFC